MLQDIETVSPSPHAESKSKPTFIDPSSSISPPFHIILTFLLSALLSPGPGFLAITSVDALKQTTPRTMPQWALAPRHSSSAEIPAAFDLSGNQDWDALASNHVCKRGLCQFDEHCTRQTARRTASQAC